MPSMAMNALDRYNPTANRSARDINFENAVRYRSRKNEANLLNPGMPAVNIDPGWDGFRGSLDRGAQDAADAGLGFSANLSGIGRFAHGEGAPMDQMTARTIVGNQRLSDMTDRSKMNNAAIRALEAQARIAENAAADSDWKDDPYRAREATGRDLERAGSVADFNRKQRVLDAENMGLEYMAGDPARRVQHFDTLGRTREMFPYSKENADVTKATIDANAKQREAAAAGSRDRTAALKSLTDLARFRAGQPQEIDDPTGAREGGFLGFGSTPKRVPNPAYGDLTDAMGAAYDILGTQNPADATGGVGGKVMSVEDLDAFAREKGMSLQEAEALAQQHGWTVRR